MPNVDVQPLLLVGAAFFAALGFAVAAFFDLLGFGAAALDSSALRFPDAVILNPRVMFLMN